MADAIMIPKREVAEHSADCFGYLYLGYRASLPDPPIGAEVPATPIKLLYSVRQASNPSESPVLVDWLSDNTTFVSHKDYAHVLTLGGGVHKVPRADATHRWTSGEGVKFYW